MPNKIYCGAGKVPKGQSRGSMKQCIDKNQIRYWGVKKVDSRLLETRGKKKGSKVTRDKLAVKMIGLRGKVSKLSKMVAEEKDKKKKTRLSRDLQKAKTEFKEVAAMFNKLDKKRSQSRTRKGSRTRSRKGSRRSKSKRRKTSRAKRGRSKKRSKKKSKRSRSRRRRSKSKSKKRSRGRSKKRGRSRR